MSLLRLFVLALVALCVNSEYLTKKNCRNVDTSQCNVHFALLEPCPHAPSFCTLKRGKQYTLSMDFTPAFTANHMVLAMYGDDANNGTFSKLVKSPSSACDHLTCPIEAGMRRIFDINFQLDKTFPVTKFPLKLKLWNKEDETKSCCFSFTVKIHK